MNWSFITHLENPEKNIEREKKELLWTGLLLLI